MTQRKITYLAFFIILQFFALAHAGNFILSAQGQGETLKDAEASAVTALSEQIISKVESSFRSEVSVKNDDVNRDMQSIKHIKSNLILKGVQYTDESKDGDGIRITAGMDRKAIHSTVDYMKQQLDVDFAILNREKKEEALVTSDQLTAFISVLPGSMLHDLDDIESWNKNKREELLKHLYMGRVEFIANAPAYSVTMEGKALVSGSFLNAGSYEFEASAEDYRSMTGQFTVSAGETVKVKLPFIKSVSSQTISLDISNEYLYLQEDVVTALSDLGINIAPNANNSLIIQIKDSISEVESYTSHQVEMRIEAQKRNEKVKKVTLRKNIIVEGSEENTLQNSMGNLAKRGIVALMSRIDLEEYFK